MYQFQYSIKNPDMPVAYASFEAMHSCMELILPALEKEQSYCLSQKVFTLTQSLDSLANRFDPQSELSRVNSLASKQPIEVSPRLFSILLLCDTFYKNTLGYFDVCIASAKTFKKFEKRFILDRSQNTVSFTHPGIQFDLGGFAKGYAVAAIEELLRKENITSGLINFGNSSICAIGRHPFGNSWKIGLKHIYQPEKSIRSFELYNQSLSTSGNTPRHSHHIVSPDTGQFVEGLSVVSVCGTSPLQCEILSTALFAASTAEQTKILDNFNDYKAIAITCDANGSSTVTQLTKNNI